MGLITPIVNNAASIELHWFHKDVRQRSNDRLNVTVKSNASMEIFVRPRTNAARAAAN